MKSIRVAIVGVGNCSAALVQGVQYYADAEAGSRVPGLMHVQFGDYHVRDIEFVAAFDVDAKKVGLDLAEAIGASENNTINICDVVPLGVTVQRGHTLDGLGRYYRETTEESDSHPADVVEALRAAEVDVLVSYLPVGSDSANCFYAQCALEAGVAFVNALPVFIASDPVWARKFADAGVPIVGDDIKSQVGATITHRVLAKLMSAAFPGHWVLGEEDGTTPETRAANFHAMTKVVPCVRSLRIPGSVALNLAYIAAGRLSGFWELDLRTWDIAAGVLLVLEAGGRVTDRAGAPYTLDVRNLMATNGGIHSELAEVLAAA